MTTDQKATADEPFCRDQQNGPDQPSSRHQENGQTPEADRIPTMNKDDSLIIVELCCLDIDRARKLLAYIRSLKSQVTTLQKEKEALTKGIEEGQYLMTSIRPSNEVAKAYRHFTDLLYFFHVFND